MLIDPEVALWNPAPGVTDHDAAAAWCRRGADWTSGTHATFSMVDPADDSLLGNISLFAIDREQATAQVGYRIAAHARGHGLATTALSAICDWAFAEHQLFRIEIRHAVENVRSCRVATKAGFAQEGTLRLAAVYGDGRRHDEHLHARLASD
jgi:RimJ/RimL family protein N-acetyltransferase